MKKRLFMIAMAAIMMLSLGCQSFAAKPSESEELLDPTISEEIFSRYIEEISDIEEEYGVEITGYTEEISDLIKQAARDAYNTEKFDRRSQLATELSMAKYEQTRVNPRVASYLGKTTVKSYGPIKGVVLDTIATGLTTSRTVKGSVGIKYGEVLNAITFSGSVSVTVQTVASGPADGTMLVNGKKATHRIVTGVLWGTVVKKTYVDVDPWTGAQMGDPYYEYEVIDEDGVIYSHLAQISSPMYVERSSQNSCVTDTNFNKFKENLKKNPGNYI